MSDPNSKSSDILSDGPVKDILRPELATDKFSIPIFLPKFPIQTGRKVRWESCVDKKLVLNLQSDGYES
jgi:hypothetical protein